MTTFTHQPDATSNTAGTSFVSVGGVAVAYRHFGQGAGPPLLFCNRFRGTLDHWDPLFVDSVAQHRPVLLFDSLGVGRTEGTAPTTTAEMAGFGMAFVESLGIDRVDLLGWSMGGCVAQEITTSHPDRVDHVVLAGTTTGLVVDAPPAPPRVAEIARKPATSDDDFLYLFFHDSATSQERGRQHLTRLGQRTQPPGPEVSPESAEAQLDAFLGFVFGSGVTVDDLSSIDHPALVANGHHDRMIHAYNSYVLAQTLPNAELVLYPDAGHGFLFQHPQRFADDVVRFLTR